MILFHKTILDVLSSRHKRTLIDYLSRIPLLERKRVKYVSIDMWETYKDVASRFLPCNQASKQGYGQYKNPNYERL